MRQELEIFQRCILKIKEKCTEFECKIIFQSSKKVGLNHVKQQIQHLIEGIQMKTCDMIGAFDMVNEEDTSPEI